MPRRIGCARGSKPGRHGGCPDVTDWDGASLRWLIQPATEPESALTRRPAMPWARARIPAETRTPQMTRSTACCGAAYSGLGQLASQRRGEPRSQPRPASAGGLSLAEDARPRRPTTGPSHVPLSLVGIRVGLPGYRCQRRDGGGALGLHRRLDSEASDVGVRRM